MRTYLTYMLLLGVKGLSGLLYRHEVRWVGGEPEDPWSNLRLVAILNHTSLFEPVFAGGVPRAFLEDVARRGVVPVAAKTARRPVVGLFFRQVARHVVPVTRERDETWDRFLARIHEDDSMVLILPEGRMKRRTGLDKHDRPMTVRGGIADILRAIPEGRMLLAYSGGLHHVHAPGDRWPRCFRTVRLRLELMRIETYRDTLMREVGADGFKVAVIRDLERRRDTHCPVRVRTDAGARTA